MNQSRAVRAPVKKQPEPESADDEEEDDEEEPSSLLGSSRNLAGSVIKETRNGGARVLNTGAGVVRKGGHVAKTVSQTARQNGNKLIDEGLLSVIGLLNALGNLGSDGMKNTRKIGGAKVNLIRQTSNNVTNLGVSSTKLAGQAINTPIKMLGDTADIARVGLTIPANASGLMKRTSIGIMKAIGASDPSEDEEEETDVEDAEEIEEPEPPKKPVSPKKQTQKSTQPPIQPPTQAPEKESPKKELPNKAEPEPTKPVDPKNEIFHRRGD